MSYSFPVSFRKFKNCMGKFDFIVNSEGTFYLITTVEMVSDVVILCWYECQEI